MAHTTTLFSQMLSLIPRHVFQKLEARHKVGRSSRKFGFKEQFTAMAFIQLATRRSMRDGLRVLNAARKKLYHFGLSPVARSTFADANNSRPVGFFKDLFAEMYTPCAIKAQKHKFRFKCKLYSLDATTISLCLSLFPWAQYRKNKGSVKVNTLLDHGGHIPAFVTIAEAKTHESRMVKSLSLPKGAIVTFDKGLHQLRLVLPTLRQRLVFRHTPQGKCRVQTCCTLSGQPQNWRRLRPYHRSNPQPRKDLTSAAYRLQRRQNRQTL